MIFHFVGFETQLARSPFLQSWQPVAQTYARIGATVELNAPLGRVGPLPYSYVAKYTWPDEVFRARFGDRTLSDAGAPPVRAVQLGFFSCEAPALLVAPKAIAFFDAFDAVQTLLDEWQAQKPKVRSAAVYRALTPNARYQVGAEATSMLGGDDVSGLFASLLPRAVGVYQVVSS